MHLRRNTTVRGKTLHIYPHSVDKNGHVTSYVPKKDKKRRIVTVKKTQK